MATDKNKVKALIEAAKKGNAACLEILMKAGTKVNWAYDLDGEISYVSDDDGDSDEDTKYDKHTALTAAAEYGHDKCLTALIKAAADVNVIDHHGNTALMSAALYGKINTLTTLIEAGADVNLAVDDYNHNTALMKAVQNGHVGCAQKLIQSGADVNIADYDGNTALICAVQNDNLTCVEKLLAAGADVNANYNKRYRETALLKAAANGSVDCIRILLDAGAEISAWDIHHAAKKDHFNCVDVLLKSLSNVKIHEKPEMFLLHDVCAIPSCRSLMEAVKAGHQACVEIFSLQGEDAISYCRAEQSYKITKCLIEKGADVNGTYYNTALFNATKYHKCVELLLQAGADVNACGHCGETAIHTAVELGYCKSLDILIHAGADVNAKDKLNGTAIMKAAYQGNEKCLNLLLQAGADVNVFNDHGYTALMQAAIYVHSKCVELLLQAGANVDPHYPDTCRWSPLRLVVNAYELVHYKLIKLLPDVNADEAVHTPKGVKCHKAAECITLLVSGGADVNVKTVNGKEILWIILRKHSSGHNVDCKCRELSVDRYSLVRLFLHAGADLREMLQLLEKQIQFLAPDLLLLLAAGATTGYLSQVKDSIQNDVSAGSIQQLLPNRSNLMSLCRSSMRDHLLNTNPSNNLFISVPRLGLPSVLTDYLLFHTFIEKENDDKKKCSKYNKRYRRTVQKKHGKRCSNSLKL